MGSVLAVAALGQSDSIVDSPHNLSASGPGTIHATNEEQICIFCHTPHNAAAVQPLWNRQTPVSAYRVYSSNSLQALPGQPTASSKLCLSCHDGTIAVGSVLSRNQSIAMAGGMTTITQGKGNLGTDLSDDHPISFRYDADLVVKAPKLKNPTALPPGIRLDSNKELQCLSCHDAHNNRYGKFLAVDNSNSQLCKACHQQGITTVSTHVDCAACHQPHSAPSGPYLLKAPNVTTTCTSCHSSAPGPTRGADIASVLASASRHDTNSAVNLIPHVPDNIVCNDCHEPHTMSSGTSVAPLLPPNLGKINGITASGALTPRAQYEYEVCFKCHGDRATSRSTPIARRATQVNKRLQFAPTAASFHPVEIAGRSSNVPSLKAPMNAATLIYCSDCHASNASAAGGGAGPKGPHGSAIRPLLVAQYITQDDTPESASAYALCYTCHDRTNILQDRSFSRHQKHITVLRSPCSVCHDSHGIASGQGNTTNNAHLINFDTTVVTAETFTNRLEYISTGNGKGSCYLRCHGRNHSPLSYSSN